MIRPGDVQGSLDQPSGLRVLAVGAGVVGYAEGRALRALGHDSMPQLSVFRPGLLRALKRIRVV